MFVTNCFTSLKVMNDIYHLNKNHAQAFYYQRTLNFKKDSGICYLAFR